MKKSELRQIIKEELQKVFNEDLVNNNSNFTDFLNKFAEDNFGFDPDGNPAYYVYYHLGVISMGIVVNPKFQSAVMNFNKDEVKNSMRELAQELINNIKKNFNKDYYIEFIIINDKKYGFILRSR